MPVAVSAAVPPRHVVPRNPSDLRAHGVGRVFRTRYGSRPAGLQAENKEFKLDDKTFNDVHVVTLKRLIDQQSGRGPGTHRTDAGKFAPG